MTKREDTTAKPKKVKKKRWYSYLADAYKISAKTFSWTPYAVFGSLFGIIAVSVLVGILTDRLILWSIMGVLLGATVALLILTQLVKKASYMQIDGVPGAVAAVLDQVKRGWTVSSEPVRFNPRTQDMIFRAIGRPGVVLISEGPSHRVQKLLSEERQWIKRVAPGAPVHVIKVGNDEGQVSLEKLQAAMRRLPKAITNQEISALAVRLDAVKPSALPIPKGIDPTKVRANRRAMRG
ncbi:DUF4191 domain-containing protein [Arcanobacterium bovis]|uniref:DUF4191 domain-containing protein n=1 Tax=Arcanobacterium bovis TaxID=2529275 RepID=A0A4Q9V2M0_9ACTO|nr:DUF4191 domain-containing protein [Arcanobacterium bovis]TBW22818.1 DUF4191 domain-containing protein [Arcanobacterium bovis]